MQIPQRRPQAEAGSVLLVSLMITAILGLTLASYLLMAHQQNQSVMRSQTWNSAIVMSEAGVEDALAMINKFNSNFDKLTNWSTSSSLYNDNWTDQGGGKYFVRRYLDQGYYDVYVINTNGKPRIRSIGHTPWTYNGGAGPKQTYATVGTSSQTYGPKMVTREVTVNTRIDPLFNVAMAALEKIDFNGRNVQTDSFDSGDPLFSDGGMYPALYPARQKDNGDVVTDLTIVNSLNVGNASIKGHAKTGPNGTLAIGPNGSVGSKAWVESGKKGVEEGYFSDDMNVLFPPVQLPSSTWYGVSYYSSAVTITNTIVTGGTASEYVAEYNWVINGNGDYYISDLSKPLHVTGHARLLILNKFALNGSSDRIVIAPTNSSLKMYVYCASAAIAGNGIVNLSGFANNFYYFGLPTNTKLSFDGNASFTGVIYAPQADFSLGGGGNDVYDFVGASVSRSVKMNGHYNFHYDEALRNNGMGRGYIPTSWEEM
jgi:hypothetical protein